MQLVRNFWQSQIGKKVVMAVTGLILVGFVVGHMVGNLQVFQSAAKLNAYGYFLKHTVGGALWAVRGVLLASVILHVVAAVQLTRQKQAARPSGQGYQKYEPQISTFASRTIRWGGFLLLAFIVFHILHFTTLTIYPDYSPTDVYNNVVKGFQIPWVTAFYVLAMGALALHLFHGAWSSLRTLGLSRPAARPTARPIVTALAGLVALGFAVVPLAVFFGAVQPAAPEQGIPAEALEASALQQSAGAPAGASTTAPTSTLAGH
ncbi:succinate dehydrogenase cytochrome b subunit [Roseisolibacter sp. H3M3-2]|uniref:succinate dehydrogenase cytochrome b subunit n=1 Tax=Roseisolibacter sp. H3M3-2 TaxID=3031323 RepID=UPI0023DAE741|nr:succinate dehydrogenase cytochrome b subunit [Roseisolibacter sp. H3M3-2]MDF1501479.1 succinate dehydrogenase cytochrome b subunit [Roseisolibacter sp. H3M3-2]